MSNQKTASVRIYDEKGNGRNTHRDIKSALSGVVEDLQQSISELWKDIHTEPIGLVLEGGGGKGAYQIGVWKAMEERGIAKKITAVSGTSVGALNAALFATGDLENAIKVWSNISPDMVLAPNTISDLMKRAPAIAAMVLPIVDGVFSQEGLKNLMSKNIIPDKIKKFVGPVFATCAEMGYTGVRDIFTYDAERFDIGKTNGIDLLACNPRGFNMRKIDVRDISVDDAKRFDIRKYSETDMIDILLASSAIPIIFPTVEIFGVKYCDGGMADNLPITPLYEIGIKHIIVVRLNDTQSMSYSQYPGAQITEVIPSESLGNIISGTMNFTAENARKLIGLGYRDGMQVFR